MSFYEGLFCLVFSSANMDNANTIRYRCGTSSHWATPPLSMAASASRVVQFNPEDGSTVTTDAPDPGAEQQYLPMLCSYCPGTCASIAMEHCDLANANSTMCHIST